MAATKEKISITLSAKLLAEIDRRARPKLSRSAFIEALLQRYLKEQAQAAVDARDLAILNRAADQLNAEAEDVLSYQASLE